MSLSNLTFPVKTVNEYTWSIMKRIDPTFQKKYGNTIPFFPLSDSASGTKSWETKTYIIYDRMLKLSPTPFYPIKKEHILYAVKGDEASTFQWGTAIQYILDRQDDAAQDINEWNRNQQNPANVYFHHLRAYQAGSPSSATGGSQTRDFSNRPFYITEFIIDMEYHLTDSIESFI